MDVKIERFLCACGVPFNVLHSPYWHEMVKGINEAPKGYKSPNYEKARTVLLERETGNKKLNLNQVQPLDLVAHLLMVLLQALEVKEQ